MKINVNKLLEAVASTGLRRYVVKRFDVEPPKKDKKEEIDRFEERVNEFLGSLDNSYLDVWEYMSEEEKERARKMAEKYPQYMQLLTHNNLLFWLMRDAPVTYGIIKAHPNGEKWLKDTLETFMKKIYGFELELEGEAEEGEGVTENSNKKVENTTKKELQKEAQQ